jgi:hypothetical protein
MAGDGELVPAVDRAVVPSAPLTPGSEAGSGDGASTAGQSATHAPMQLETLAWSLANSYTVRPRPSTTIVPKRGRLCADGVGGGRRHRPGAAGSAGTAAGGSHGHAGRREDSMTILHVLNMIDFSLAA